VLAFLVPLDSPDPQGTYDRLRNEVRQYSSALAEKEHVVVLTKRDLFPADDPLPDLHAPEAVGVRSVSSAAGLGVEELKEYLWRLVEDAKANAVSHPSAPQAEEEV
jgi:GTPase involved in cell partitioning and DNA repair